jgi:hypothetical protein
LWAIYHGFVSVTPISIELTHKPSLAALGKLLGDAC